MLLFSYPGVGCAGSRLLPADANVAADVNFLDKMYADQRETVGLDLAWCSFEAKI